MTDEAERDVSWPPATLAAWRELAARELGGKEAQPDDGLLRRLTSRTAEGVELPALVTAEELGPTVPRAPLLARARRGWAPAQEYRQPLPEAAGAAALEDLSRGTEMAWFVLDEALAAGVEPGLGQAGVALAGSSDLAAMLLGIELAGPEIVIDAGARALAVLAMLANEARRRAIRPHELRGAVAGDPLALLLRVGSLGWSIEHVYRDMAKATRWAHAEAPGLRTALVDGAVWHEAGATAADEVAGALAGALEHLRALIRRGFTADEAARSLLFVLAVGRDLPLELAKLRAARSLWARVASACSVGPEGQVMRLHARASRRELTALDPWVNLIRATTEGVTAALGGADSIALPSFDEALGEPSELGRRLARNTQLLLRDESHLGAVMDPVGGSYTVERATEALARAAWERLKLIEGEGGLLASLRAGAVQARVARAGELQAHAAAGGRLPIVGASRFASRPLGPALARREAVRGSMSPKPWPDGHDSEDMVELTAAFAAGAELGAFVRPGPGEQVTPLARARLAAPFEALRARGEALAATVALVPIGTASEVRGRVEFSRGYFPIGGLAVVECAATEDVAEAARLFAATGAPVAVICGADDRYAEIVPAAIPLLRAAGARAIVLAGRPKDLVENLATLGVDVFIAAGSDIPATLGALMQRLEVPA